MNGSAERDELLECLWQLQERDASTVQALRDALARRNQPADLESAVADGLVKVAQERVALTPTGASAAEKLIRAHRIGERLIHDVLGREFESGACELEHLVNTEIVDGICTLLGHPRECPHGFAIPPGDCCRASAQYAPRTIVPLTDLRIGQSARVAYVYTSNDREMHRLASLQIRPGAEIKLHQQYPSYVIDCEGASIALDGEVAGNINVWLEGGAHPGRTQPDRAGPPRRERPELSDPGRRRFRPPRRGRGPRI